MLDFTTMITNSFLSCATCMGDEGSLINQAAGYAIVLMLVMLCLVLGSLIKFMSYLKKRENGEFPTPVRTGANSKRLN